MGKVVRRAVLRLAAVLAATSVHAQQANYLNQSDSSRTFYNGIYYLPERGTGVRDRYRPGYDPIPYHVAGLKVLPSIDVALDATDNYRATRVNRQPDVYAVVRPGVEVQSDWSRNSLDFRADYAHSFHALLPDEDVDQSSATLNGRYDIAHDAALSLHLSGQRAVESRTDISSFRSSPEPVVYTDLSGTLSASYVPGDVSATVDGGVQQLHFDDVVTDGVVFDQHYRNYVATFADASAQYRIGPGLAAVVSARVDHNDYERSRSPGLDIDRDSTGFTVRGGVNLELSSLVLGTIQAGLLHRHYADPRLRDFSGLSILAHLLWNATSLTSVRFDASRTVEDTASLVVSDNVRTTLSAAADHELYRNVILTADLNYSHLKPNGPLASADEIGAGLAGRYLVDHHITITGSARYLQRTSDLNAYRYHGVYGNMAAHYAF